MKTILALLLTAFTVTAAQTYKVSVEWDASVDTNAITGYKLYVSTNSFYNGTQSVIQTNLFTLIDAGTNLTATVSNLVPLVKYYFVATAYNSIGLESDYSNQIDYTMFKPVPPHLRVNVKLQASADVRGPWEDLADLGDFDVQEGLNFYRGQLTIH